MNVIQNSENETNRLRQRLVEERDKTAMAAEAGQMLLQQRDALQHELTAQKSEFEELEQKFDVTACELCQTQERLEEEMLALEQTKLKLKETQGELLAQKTAHSQKDDSQEEVFSQEVFKLKAQLKHSKSEARELQRENESLSTELSLQRETQSRVSLALSKAESKRKSEMAVLNRKIQSLKGILAESNTARDNTADEMARLSELTISLKRKLLDAETESRKSDVTMQGESGSVEIINNGEPFSPYLKRVLMLFAAQVSRLELDLEMQMREREGEKVDQRQRWTQFSLFLLWLGIVVQLVECVFQPDAAC